MKLFIKESDSSESIQVDFTPQLSVPCTNLFLVIYDLESFRYIIMDNGKDVLTDNYSEFYVTKLSHLMTGTFTLNNETFDAQVGFYLRKIGKQGFQPFLIDHYPIDQFYKSANSSVIFDNPEFLIVDLKDYNDTMEILNKPHISFQEYLIKLMYQHAVNEVGIDFHDELKMFKMEGHDLKLENLISSKGFSIFLEEQIKKDRKTGK